jgi:hypothetical protein
LPAGFEACFFEETQLPGVARRPPAFFVSPKKEGKERRPHDPALRVPGYVLQKMGSGRNSLTLRQRPLLFPFSDNTQPAGSKRHCLSGSPLPLPDNGYMELKSVRINRCANPDAAGENWTLLPARDVAKASGCQSDKDANMSERSELVCGPD